MSDANEEYVRRCVEMAIRMCKFAFLCGTATAQETGTVPTVEHVMDAVDEEPPR